MRKKKKNWFFFLGESPLASSSCRNCTTPQHQKLVVAKDQHGYLWQLWKHVNGNYKTYGKICSNNGTAQKLRHVKKKQTNQQKKGDQNEAEHTDSHSHLNSTDMKSAKELPYCSHDTVPTLGAQKIIKLRLLLLQYYLTAPGRRKHALWSQNAAQFCTTPIPKHSWRPPCSSQPAKHGMHVQKKEDITRPLNLANSAVLARMTWLEEESWEQVVRVQMLLLLLPPCEWVKGAEA